MPLGKIDLGVVAQIGEHVKMVGQKRVDDLKLVFKEGLGFAVPDAAFEPITPENFKASLTFIEEEQDASIAKRAATMGEIVMFEGKEMTGQEAATAASVTAKTASMKKTVTFEGKEMTGREAATAKWKATMQETVTVAGKEMTRQEAATAKRVAGMRANVRERETEREREGEREPEKERE